MSKKTKQSEPSATETPATPQAPAHGWQFNWASSGVAGLKGYLEFGRLASAVVPSVGNVARQEADTVTKQFLASDPAVLRYLELRERLAKAEAEYDAVQAKHRDAQIRFVDDPSVAPELELTASKEAGLASQAEALAAACRPAHTKARQSWAEFQRRYNAERSARLRAECLALVAKIEAAIAPLLSDFGVARDALRQENSLTWPEFNSLFPAPAKSSADEESRPQPQRFNLTANGAPIVADNRMNLPWHDRRPDPNWGREHPPIKPAMQPVAQSVEQAEQST